MGDGTNISEESNKKKKKKEEELEMNSSEFPGFTKMISDAGMTL